MNDCIGTCCISVKSLQEGYRHVPLYNWKGELLRFSTLFVYITIEDDGEMYVQPLSTSPAMASTTTGGGGGSGIGGLIASFSISSSLPRASLHSLNTHSN